jgi:hypothetical protein
MSVIAIMFVSVTSSLAWCDGSALRARASTAGLSGSNSATGSEGWETESEKGEVKEDFGHTRGVLL